MRSPNPKPHPNPRATSKRAIRFANLAALALLILGSFQMLGHFTGLRSLRGIGAASVASPYPKVFGSAPVWGETNTELETFSSSFELHYKLKGQLFKLPITPAVYERVRGPYNRRNVYGAALAYGPCLPPELTQSILDYALAEPGTLRAELGIPPEAVDLQILVRGMESSPSSEPQLREWILTPSPTIPSIYPSKHTAGATQ